MSSTLSSAAAEVVWWAGLCTYNVACKGMIQAQTPLKLIVRFSTFKQDGEFQALVTHKAAHCATTTMQPRHNQLVSLTGVSASMGMTMSSGL